MNESWAEEGAAPVAAPAVASDGVTAGALLRQAREAAGLHVAALAVSLKVPVRKLEALEEDRWDLLPDAVFVRALASSVCRTLKMDPRPVLDRLPQTAAPRLIQDNEGINTPFRSPSDGAAPSLLDQLSKPVFLAVFALLLGALVLILLPTAKVDQTVALSAPQAASAQPTAEAPPAAAQPAENGIALAKAAQPMEVAAAQPAPAPAPAAAASAVAASVPPKAAEAPNAPAPAAAATGVVVFRATSPSWVEVTDAKGAVPVRRLLAAGEATGASGALPLQVIVGRADATEVQVRGKPFDLRPVSRDNVARFEVK